MENLSSRRRAVCGLLSAVFLLGILSVAPDALAQSKPSDIPAEVFGALPANLSPKLSPDGTAFAIIIPHKGRKHVLIRPIGGNEPPVVLPPYEDSEIRWVEWANNDRLLFGLAYTSKRFDFGGRILSETRLLSASRDGKDIINAVRGKQKRNTIQGRARIAYSRAQIQDRVVDFLHDDPDNFLLATSPEKGGSDAYQVRRVNVKTGVYQIVNRGSRHIQNWWTDQSGTLRYGSGVVREGAIEAGTKETYLSPKSNRWELMDGTPIHKNFTLISFYADPEFAYVLGRNQAGIRGLHKFDMIKQEVVETIFENERYDVRGTYERPYGQEPIGVYLTTDRLETHFIDAEWAKRQRMIDGALKGTMNQIISSTRDNRYHIIASESDTEPGVYYLFDEKQKQIHFLDVKYKNLEPKLLSPMKTVSYQARDGLTIEGYLTIPQSKEAKDLPTVILPHGGPQSRDVWGYDYFAQFLASRGYAVFQPNFRGSTGYGLNFQRAGTKNWGLKMQDDITDGTNWLIEEGIADPERICIIGGSYGGYAALMGAVKTPDLFKCAASINGVSNLPRMIANDEHFIGGATWIQSIGDPGEDRTVLRETSPFHQIDKIRIPILLIHAKDDARVPMSHSKDMAKALKKKKKSVRFVKLPSGGHTLETEEARIATLKALEKFLAKNIGG